MNRSQTSEGLTADSALRLSEEHLRLLVNAAKDYAIIMLDPHGRVVTWNEGAQQLKGYTQAEIVGHSMECFYPAEAVAAGTPARLLALAAAEGRCEDEGWRVRKDGTSFFADVVITSMRDPTGQLVGFAKITRDITERKEIQDKLAAANRELEILATHDGLTGLANRRCFDEKLDAEFHRAMRDGTTLSFVMIDIDHFKGFNDCYGHPAGDDCLSEITLAMKDALHRPGDMVARYGGEEFALLLPNTPEVGALSIAERIRQAVRSRRIEYAASQQKIVTISLGVASLVPKSDGHRPEDLVSVADRALYAAKAGGRDMICSAHELRS